MAGFAFFIKIHIVASQSKLVNIALLLITDARALLVYNDIKTFFVNNPSIKNLVFVSVQVRHCTHSFGPEKFFVEMSWAILIHSQDFIANEGVSSSTVRMIRSIMYLK